MQYCYNHFGLLIGCFGNSNPLSLHALPSCTAGTNNFLEDYAGYEQVTGVIEIETSHCDAVAIDRDSKMQSNIVS
jgi:hypothetical protein